jgi:hypothetical protein
MAAVVVVRMATAEVMPEMVLIWRVTAEALGRSKRVMRLPAVDAQHAQQFPPD